MKSKKYTDLEKNQIIKEIKDCGSITIVCKKHNVPVSTAHGWIGKSKPKSKNKVVETQSTINKLNKKVSDQALQIKILEDLLKKTNQAWLGD